jgi:hypothetical protein
MISLVRKIRTLYGIPAGERRLALHTIALMGAVRLALWFVPFRWIRTTLESSSFSASATTSTAATAKQVAWAVRLAARYVPRATCLTRALAAQILLNRAGLRNKLHIGVAREGGFEAHAWIECEDRVLVGESERHEIYSRILTIARP